MKNKHWLVLLITLKHYERSYIQLAHCLFSFHAERNNSFTRSTLLFSDVCGAFIKNKPSDS